MKAVTILITIAVVGAAIWLILGSRRTERPNVGISPQPQPSGKASKAEWMGESGYCNCLLVTMARVRIPELLLSTKRDLPDLVTLSANRADTQAWLKTQNLDLNALNKTTIIRTFAELAGITPDGNTRGTIDVRDVEGDSGPVVTRKFDVLLGRDGDGMAVRISQTLNP